MSEPTGCAGGCPRTDTYDDIYCDRCDLLVGLPGLRVIKVHPDGRRLVVTVESPRVEQGCRSCGVVAGSHGRRTVRLVDAPSFGRPVRIVWRKRTWECEEPSCEVGVFTEQHDQVARPKALLSTRACWWAIKQLRFEHASVLGLARQLGTTWRTLWRSIEPLLQQMADDPDRFDDVSSLGVDEHIWHHVDERKQGPKAWTGMVDLTRDQAGRTRARLLDLVPGRSGKAYADWLKERGDAFRRRVAVATLDPFHGYKNAIDDQLQDAVSVLDAFHVVKLGGQVVDRDRAEPAAACSRRPTATAAARTTRSTRSGTCCVAPRNASPNANRPASPRRSTPTNDTSRSSSPGSAPNSSAGSTTSPTRPPGGVSPSRSSPASPAARSPRSPASDGPSRSGGREFLAYFDTAGASNGGTEAVNGLIELHRRIARGFRNRDNYRLRMLLIGGGLTSPHLK